MRIACNDFASSNITALSRGLARGEFSPTELVDFYLGRIATLDKRIGSFTRVYEDEAQQAAASATAAWISGRRLGPFHGIPFAVKDIIDMAGRFTAFGSRSSAGRIARATAPYVQVMLDAGMIPIGKTHTVEFAFGAWGINERMGTPKNPLRMEVPSTPGGSSSGSGAAVGAGFVPWAIGTDTGGSIRIPSAFCGLAGFRPSISRYPTVGVMPLSQSLDTIGPLARTVEDVQLLDDLVVGRHDTDVALSTGGLASLRHVRIGTVRTEWLGPMETEVADAFARSLRRLEHLGASLVDISMPFGREEFAELTSALIAYEGLRFAGPFVSDMQSPMNDDVRARFLIGRRLNAEGHAALLVRRAEMVVAFAEAMNGCVALLTPTTPCVAQPLLTLADNPYNPAVFTRFAAWLRCCAVAMPNGKGCYGLPTSLQIVGLEGSDRTVLQIARYIESPS